MRHHILLPTDFSENAWCAAIYAIKLYAKQPCTFYFSHAWTFLNLGTRTYIPQSSIEPAKKDVKKQLAALVKKAEAISTNHDHNFKTIFSEGSLEDTIEFAIKKHKIDLVVMGTKGATRAKELLFGSNTVAVIDKVNNCPFMLVPSNYEYEKPDYIGFPTDFKRQYVDKLQPVKDLAQLHGSEIKILHINVKKDLTDKQNANMEMLNTYLEDYPHDFNYKPKPRKKEKAITEFIKENDIKILTMINYEHSFIEKLIKEPIIKKMGFHCFIPFLVIPSGS